MVTNLGSSLKLILMEVNQFLLDFVAVFAEEEENYYFHNHFMMMFCQ